MINELNISNTPINGGIFDDLLYPDINLDLFNIRSKYMGIRDINNMIISVIWDESKKYIESFH